MSTYTQDPKTGDICYTSHSNKKIKVYHSDNKLIKGVQTPDYDDFTVLIGFLFAKQNGGNELLIFNAMPDKYLIASNLKLKLDNILDIDAVCFHTSLYVLNNEKLLGRYDLYDDVLTCLDCYPAKVRSFDSGFWRTDMEIIVDDGTKFVYDHEEKYDKNKTNICNNSYYEDDKKNSDPPIWSSVEKCLMFIH